MAQYSNLKAYIEEKIYENGTQAITGDILQDVLKVMTDDLGEFYQTGGVASPSTDPGTPDAKVIYFATEAGTYTNFGGITLAAGEVALLIFETSWTKETLNVLSAANGGVKTANLADGAVTTEKIAGGAVGTAKIANSAVTSGKVADGAIGTAKIADGAIDADKIAANAVESAKIKNGAVTEGKINDGAVTAGKVAANAVTTAKIADDAVTTAKLNDGAVTEDKIATDAVTSGKVKDGAIGTAKIAAGAVTHAKIGAGAVEESNIKDGAVTSDKIADGAVGSDQLAEGAFSAENLADGSVTTDKLADDAVTAEKIVDGAVTAGKFANGSVTTIKLGSGAVTTEKIGDGMVTRQKLADSSVGTSKIIDGAVTTDKVADGAITDAKLENPVSVSQNTSTTSSEQGAEVLMIGNAATPIRVWNKYLTDAKGAENNIIEIYITGLDLTKQYYASQFRQFTLDEQTYNRLDIREVGGSQTLARLQTTTLTKSITPIEEQNSSGISGYAIINLESDDSTDKQCVFNTKMISTLDESPAIKAYIFENKIDAQNLAKNGHIEWIEEASLSNNGFVVDRVGYPQHKISHYLKIDAKSDIIIKNGWYDNSYDIPIVPLSFYDENKIYISSYIPNGDTGRYNFTILAVNVPSNAYYIRVNGNFLIDEKETQIIQGVNLLPIASEEQKTEVEQGIGCDVYTKDSLTVNGMVNGVNGNMDSTANFKRTPFINIKGCESIILTIWCNPVATNNNGYAFFNANKQFISGGVNHDSVPYKILTLTPPANAVYLVVCYPSDVYPYIEMSLNDFPFYVKVNYRVVEKSGFSTGNFDQTGSFENPSGSRSKTSQILIKEGELLEYHSVSLDSVVAAIFDSSDNVLCKSERGLGGQATIIHGTLVAPQGASYACVYSLQSSHALYPTNGFLPSMRIFRRGYKSQVFDDAFDARISEMRKGTPSEAQEKKIKDVVFTQDGDFVIESSNDYNPQPVATISSDDAIEGYIQHSTGPVISQGGFFSRMFPICETAGKIPSCEAVEFQRVVNDINTETPNNSGIAIKALCAARNWEAMNHTMTARFTAAYAFDTWEDAMAAVAAHTINPVGTAGLTENSTTHIYIRDRKVNYYYTKAIDTYSTDVADWSPVPYQYIKPKLQNTSGVRVSLNPTFPYEYQINVAKKKISRMLETDVETFVAPSDSNSYKMLEFALLTHKQTPNNRTSTTDDFTYQHGINKMPLLTHIARLGGLDLAEGVTDNVAGNSVYNAWKTMFDNLIGLGSKAVIYGCHIYRHCWLNRIPDDASVPTAAKIDTVSGGTYPESWILPVRKPQDFPNDFLLPHPNTNLNKWGSFTMQSDGSIKDEDGVTVMDGNGDFVEYSETCWMPCYGTRLFQLWRFMLYIQSQGVPFMNLKDNIARLYNRLSVGFYPYTYNNASFKVQDEPADSSYYLVGADGSKLYHKA